MRYTKRIGICFLLLCILFAVEALFAGVIWISLYVESKFGGNLSGLCLTGAIIVGATLVLTAVSYIGD